MARRSWGRYFFEGIAVAACFAVLWCHGTNASAAQLLFEGPTATVFTNLASRLLKSELGLDASAIQIYPTNHYTAPVHRLLQLSANLADAAGKGVSTGGMVFPSVFRPLFKMQPGAGGTNTILIHAFEEVTNAEQVLDPYVRWIDPTTLATNPPIGSHDMVYGVPVVIAARKGFPNFNEFAMQTSVQLTRKLEFRREPSLGRINETNVMHLLSISNLFGIEAWNSYLNAYSNTLGMRAEVVVFAKLTNELGTVLVDRRHSATNTVTIPAGSWVGYTNPLFSLASFQVPFAPNTNVFVTLSNSVFRETMQQFQPAIATTMGFERHPGASYFPVPRWSLSLRIRVHFSLTDTKTGRLVDFVNLDQSDEPLDMTSLFSSDGYCSRWPDGADGSMWCTNRWNDEAGTNIGRPTYGILNQIAASTGEVEAQNWNSEPTIKDKQFAQQFFYAQFMPAWPGGPFAHTNVFYAPYNARRTLHYQTSWSANDPLVHYTVADLTDYYDSFQTNRISFYGWSTNHVGSLNRRFEPWGGNPSGGSWNPTTVDVTVKDSMVIRSDDWNFPTNGLDLASIGHVHRGTPWQTVYLKSGGPNLVTWRRWLGWIELRPGVLDWWSIPPSTHPINDWRLVSMLAPSLNTNVAAALHSLNQPSREDWAQVMDGVVVRTNYNSTEEPLVVSSNSPQCAIVAAAIDQARMALPGQRFTELGQLLSVPALSLASPWLGPSQPRRSPSEAAYEALPAQLLPLLRADSIASVASGSNGAEVTFTGWEGAAYQVQASTNLIDWVTISTQYATNGVLKSAVPFDRASPPIFLRSEMVH